ncbi:MAG: DNA repair protein RecN [Catenibacillus sp.]
MLTGIRVKNLALIDEVEVDFTKHLNILTGETGAGKSILIGSVNAALGKKLSKDMIRKGQREALVELYFTVRDVRIKEALEAQAIPWEDGELIISRKITPSRSISRMNGEVVSAACLKEIGEMLVDIHGQHEHQSLLHRHHHLEILDHFAKDALGDIKQQLKLAYESYMAIKKELADASCDTERRRRDQAFMTFEVEEIEQAHLIQGEDEELAALYRKMSNSRQIMEGAAAAYGLTGYEGGGAGEAIGRALRALGAAQEYDQTVAQFALQLEDIDNLMNDFNREISAYMSELTFDSQQFADVETRLDLINNLKAKYGKTISDILAYKEKKMQELDKLAHYDEYMEDLRTRLKQNEEVLESLCAQVSKIRKQYARLLAGQITKALKDLNFLDVRFDWQFERLDTYTSNGMDDAQFMISTNPGEDMKPLTQVASGGELSRIMLAIKSVLADVDAVDTLIFDEIDTGISGRTAQKVAEKLAYIAGGHQVLCITHLPQIAAMADSHYMIEKTASDEKTATSIRALDDQQMIQEIARLLGGVELTDTVYKNAFEMKKMADKVKRCLRKEN